MLFENRLRHRDGSYRWLRWNVRPVPGRERIYAIARDITQQILLESEIVAIADREKERMGRELHNGLCQNLAGIAALSATLSRRLAAHADPAAEIAKLLNDTGGVALDRPRAGHAPNRGGPPSQHQDHRIPPRAPQAEAAPGARRGTGPTRDAMG